MFRVPAVIRSMVVVCACAGVVPLAGCGSAQQQADKAAKEAVAQADIDRAKAGDSDNRLQALDTVQKTYDNLASDPNLSPQMQILLRGRQGQLRLERVGLMIAQLRAQELVIARDIDQINQLAMQVAAAQANVEALKSYDPGASIAKLTAQRDQIQGSASQLTWMMPNPTATDPNGKITSPTLFAVKQEIDDLTNKIQQNQADSDAAHKLSAAKGDEAEQYLRRAEGETGQPNVTDTTKSADDRRDAAYADAKVATLANDLIRLSANLDRAKNQQSALEAAVKSLDDQAQAQQTRWASIQAQIKDQQKIQQNLINGTGGQNELTMTALAQDLSQNVNSAAALRETVNTEINTVLPQLGMAITMCNQLRQDWVTQVREKQDDPDAVIWKQAQETLHPMYFNLQVASALESRASVAAAKARIDQMIYDMYGGNKVDPAEIAPRLKKLAIAPAQGPIVVPGLTELLKPEKTGTQIPKAFGDVPPPDSDALAQAQGDANKAFQDTIDAYEKKFASIDSGPAADERRNLSLSGEAHADREWAEFAALMGDTAGVKNHLQAASDAESQIDPGFTLAVNAVGNSSVQQSAAGAGASGGATPAPRAPGMQ